MEVQIKYVLALFHIEQVDKYELQSIRQETLDSRWIIYVYCGDVRYVIKIASNGFTTKERVNGWPLIIEEYGKLGYYSPMLRKSVNGNYAEEFTFQGKQYVVWEEEYAKYNLFSNLDKAIYINQEGRFVFHEEVFEFVGKVAEQHYDIFPYKSGWVRLEPFGSDEETDEVWECVNSFEAIVKEKAPHFLGRWDGVKALFEKNKEQLASIYSELPTSVFQADTFRTNLILDDTGHFKGVIDYNLAGLEVVINIFLVMILFGYSYMRKKPSSSDVLPEFNKETQDSVIEIMLDTLRSLRRYYTFNELEVKAIPLLYKYISCIEYTQIEALEKYAGDDKKLKMLFDYMEQELLREDIDFRGVMLG